MAGEMRQTTQRDTCDIGVEPCTPVGSLSIISDRSKTLSGAYREGPSAACRDYMRGWARPPCFRRCFAPIRGLRRSCDCEIEDSTSQNAAGELLVCLQDRISAGNVAAGAKMRVVGAATAEDTSVNQNQASQLARQSSVLSAHCALSDFQMNRTWSATERRHIRSQPGTGWRWTVGQSKPVGCAAASVGECCGRMTYRATSTSVTLNAPLERNEDSCSTNNSRISFFVPSAM